MDLLEIRLNHPSLIHWRLADGRRLAAALDELCAERGDLHSELLSHKREWPLGWLSLPWGGDWVGQCETTAQQLSERCEELIVCGIGGSALGLQAVYAALDGPRNRLRRVSVVDNVDPTLLARVARSPNLSGSALSVISKSGTTLETMASFLHLLSALETTTEPTSRPRQRVVVTTDPDSGPLRELATKREWYSLPVPSNVGGRFSVLSPVGLFPLAFAGINIRQLLTGARELQEQLLSMPQRTNAAWLLAAISYLLHMQGSIRETVHYIYGDQLKWLGDWFRQLWAESLAKANTIDGGAASVCLTPIVARGSTDQHSQNQLFMEGPNDKLFGFITCEQWDDDPKVLPDAEEGLERFAFLGQLSFGRILSGCYRGTRNALMEVGRPVYEIILPHLRPENIGAYLQLWMLATAYAGLLYGVNAFDQPGVERSKKITMEYLGQK